MRGDFCRRSLVVPSGPAVPECVRRRIVLPVEMEKLVFQGMTQQAIPVEKFIEAVRKRPALWDSESEDYKDRVLKKDGWLEVCLLMCPNFADKSEADRNQIGRDMQLKWKNLRDAYVRHIRMRLDSSKKSRPLRAYIYHNQLSFLRRVINPRQKIRRFPFKSSPGDEVKVEDEDELTQEDLIEMVEHDVKSSLRSSSSDEEEEQQQAEEVVSHVDPLLPEAVEGNTNNSDDMNFFKSLLPSLQTLRMDQKLKFRIDVMELLMTYHQGATEKL